MQANTSYEAAIGQLSRGTGNLLWQVETLKPLGAKTGKSLSVAFDAGEDGAGLPPPEE